VKRPGELYLVLRARSSWRNGFLLTSSNRIEIHIGKYAVMNKQGPMKGHEDSIVEIQISGFQNSFHKDMAKMRKYRGKGLWILCVNLLCI